MKTVSIPCYNRPEYLHKVLRSIEAAEGHDGWMYIFSVDPSGHGIEMCNLLETFGHNSKVFYNPTRLGLTTNTWMAANHAWVLGSDFNVYLEEDDVISPDTFLMLDAFMRHPFMDPDGSVICLRRKTEIADEVNSLSCANDGLLGCGFAYFTTMWPKRLRPAWFRYYENMPGYEWDWSLDLWMIEQKIPQWRPHINRSQNIGLNGQNTDSEYNPHMHGPCNQEVCRNFVFIP